MTKEEQVISILAEHGIKILIGGCGCCGSPWVSFEKDGLLIVDNEEDFYIDMFSEDKND